MLRVLSCDCIRALKSSVLVARRALGCKVFGLGFGSFRKLGVPYFGILIIRIL